MRYQIHQRIFSTPARPSFYFVITSSLSGTMVPPAKGRTNSPRFGLRRLWIHSLVPIHSSHIWNVCWAHAGLWCVLSLSVRAPERKRKNLLRVAAHTQRRIWHRSIWKHFHKNKWFYGVPSYCPRKKPLVLLIPSVVFMLFDGRTNA